MDSTSLTLTSPDYWSWANLLLPIIVPLVAGAVGWYLKSKTEEVRAMQASLVAKRREIYIEVLKPFIKALTPGTDQNSKDNIANDLLKQEYRILTYEVLLMGNDEVVQAYNELMQASFKMSDQTTKAEMKKFMLTYGKLLLSIRQSLGIKATNLEPEDMLISQIKDLDKFLKS